MTEVITTRSRSIVSVPEFEELPDLERRLAYMAGYKSWKEDRVFDPHKREQLLKRYIEIAGWDEESVKGMQDDAVTPVR